MTGSVAGVSGLTLRYGKVTALDNVTLEIPEGRMVGLIGPDGVGKSSLLSLLAGARVIQQGKVEVLGGDMRDVAHRNRVCPRTAYMPQGLGKNLYPTLSVEENLDFFGSLFGHDKAERERRITDLLAATGMTPFRSRPASKLSGGMKQKLGLCCALIHDPDFLILDEPTTGVDPLSRRQFWDLIDRIRATRPGMSVITATAYMEEAARFDWLVAMNAGRVAVEFVPQGILAERIRVGGAGMAAFLSDIGIDTDMAKGKQRVTMPDGRDYLVEPALRADFALVHAAAADGFGNLRFNASARNFNPLMAMAARTTIAEAETVLPMGGLGPDDIHIPGPFVDRVVALPATLPEVYGVVQR